MNILSKTAITTLATLTVSLGAALMASSPSQAAGMSIPAPVSQSGIQGQAEVIKVGGRRHGGHRSHRRHGRHHGGHGRFIRYGYARDCVLRTQRHWSPRRGHYVFRKVRVCY